MPTYLGFYDKLSAHYIQNGVGEDHPFHQEQIEQKGLEQGI